MNTAIHTALFMLAMILTPSAATAQHTTPLPLAEAIARADRNNSHVKAAQLATRVARAEHLQTDAVYLPQVSLGYAAAVTNNPLGAFGFLLQQSRVAAADFNPASLNDPAASYNYGATVEVKLPLVNLDMAYARKGARLKEEATTHQARHVQQQVRYEVSRAYTQLQYAYTTRDILAQTLADTRAIRQTVSNFHAQGLIQQSDVLNADVQVSTIETALAKATSAIATASQALVLLMDGSLAQGDTTIVTEPLSQLPTATAPAMFSPLRADIVAMQRGADATSMMVKSRRMAFIPRLNAFGSYQLNDKRLFRFGADSYMAGIQLSWTLFSGNENTGKLRAAKAQEEQARLRLSQHIDQSRLEADKTRRDLADLRYEIRQHDTSIAQAAEALRIMADRHREGLASTTDLLAAQAQLSRQQLAKAQAIMHYNTTRYYQDLITTVQ